LFSYGFHGCVQYPEEMIDLKYPGFKSKTAGRLTFADWYFAVLILVTF
jgi:hypothetical protein